VRRRRRRYIHIWSPVHKLRDILHRLSGWYTLYSFDMYIMTTALYSITPSSPTKPPTRLALSNVRHCYGHTIIVIVIIIVMTPSPSRRRRSRSSAKFRALSNEWPARIQCGSKTKIVVRKPSREIHLWTYYCVWDVYVYGGHFVLVCQSRKNVFINHIIFYNFITTTCGVLPVRPLVKDDWKMKKDVKSI